MPLDSNILTRAVRRKKKYTSVPPKSCCAESERDGRERGAWKKQRHLSTHKSGQAIEHATVATCLYYINDNSNNNKNNDNKNDNNKSSNDHIIIDINDNDDKNRLYRYLCIHIHYIYNVYRERERC